MQDFETEIDAGTRAKRIKAEYGQEVQAGRLTDWDCTGMTHFMGTDCVFSGEMRMERLKDMFHGKISKRAWCPYSYRGIPA